MDIEKVLVNIMRILKIIMITSVLCLLVISSLNCAPTTVPESQVVWVQRGDLKIDITASGHLVLSRKEDLAFEVSSRLEKANRVLVVKEVLVEEGESVEKGQLLAKLDTSEWEDEVRTLERQLTAKKRDLTQKKMDMLNAEIALEDAEAQYVWSAEVLSAREAVWLAERNLEAAQLTLDYALIARDIKVWTRKVADAEETLRAARVRLDELLAVSAGDKKISLAKEKLWAAQVKLDELLAASTPDTPKKRAERKKEIDIRRLKVELAQEQLEDAQNELERVAIQRLKVELAQGKLDDAEKAVEDAQRTLDELKSMSTVIIAPFSGIITKVNVEDGDEVKRGKVAMQLADPNRFEADILVAEWDIFHVTLGKDVSLLFGARPDISLPAKVTHISPMPTIESGVTIYEVKVELEPPTPVESVTPSEGQEEPQRMLEDFYKRLDEAVKAGRISQEQAEQIKEPLKVLVEAVKAGRISPGQLKQITECFPLALEERQKWATIMPQDFQLREGLTVNVSILVAERKDVLLVPNYAVIREDGGTYVQVLKDGVVERRWITIGMSDWHYTEVTRGLSEGEKCLLPLEE